MLLLISATFLIFFYIMYFKPKIMLYKNVVCISQVFIFTI